MTLPITNPQPDSALFREAVLGRHTPQRPPLFEIAIAREIRAYVVEHYLERTWVPYTKEAGPQGEAYIGNFIETNRSLGYDQVSLNFMLDFPTKKLAIGDTSAAFSKGDRQWSQEGTGPIASWEDFENYPWPSVDSVPVWRFEYLSRHLPDGMAALPAHSGVFQLAMDLLGFEGLAYGVYDNPDLVRAVFERAGTIVYHAFEQVIGLDGLMGFLVMDDMGFNTNTIIAPDSLRSLCLPWHANLAELAHRHGLLYILHSCGNIESIMRDLIDDVKIDARHSFEDSIMPVTEAKRKYGNEIAILGGVDMDRLCRLPEHELRTYIHHILDECMPGGRYMLGSGNSISNYVPLENYFLMLSEAGGWSRKSNN